MMVSLAYCGFVLSISCILCLDTVVGQATTTSTGYNELFARVKHSEDDIGQLVTDLSTKFVDDINCMTIISDSLYDNIFRTKFFTKLGYTPVFKVLVPEYEDLLAPNFKTLSVIQESRRKGCNAYIILLANADQLSRLLRFGDKYRELDTRSKYIVLYDRRLFKKELQYLWKKIVNVVFIRKFSGSSSFEFSTVPFPAPIRGVLVPRRLDTWRAGKFQKGVDLFRDKTSNLENQTLRVVTFPYLPSTVKKISSYDADSGMPNVIYEGLEIQILRTLSFVMNFRTSVYEAVNSEVEAWGRRQLNGSFSGILGEVESGRADVALGSLLYTPYYLKLLDLSIPYTSQCYTFLTPESKTDNSWMTLILPFNGIMWLAIWIAVFFSGLIFQALVKYHRYLKEDDDWDPEDWFWMYPVVMWRKYQRNSKSHDEVEAIVTQTAIAKVPSRGTSDGWFLFEDLENSVLYAFSMVLLVSLPKLPTGWSLRMYTGWWWIFCLLVAVAYRASMTAILANPAPRIVIDTLEELAESPIRCGGWGDQNKEFFETSLDAAGRTVGRKFQVMYDADEAVERVAQGSFAYYENVYFLRNAKVRQKLRHVVQRNDTSDKKSMKIEGAGRDLHIMEDCVINMPISLGLEKNSPLKPKVDVFLQRVIEAGLVEKWLSDVMLDTAVAEAPLDKDDVNALINLQKLYVGIVAIIVGFSLSTTVLLLENAHWYFAVKKDPDFDKYAMYTYFAKYRK